MLHEIRTADEAARRKIGNEWGLSTSLHGVELEEALIETAHEFYDDCE